MARKITVLRASPEEYVGDLKQLGFTEYEARIYIQLLREHPATAYEISKSTRVPRPNTYSALEALSQRGAVVPVSENPVRYVAAEPKSLMAAIARHTNRVCNEVSARLEALAPVPDVQHVWTLRGEAAVHDITEALIGNSRRTLFIKGADNLLRRHMTGLKAAADRGVEILIVLFGQNPDEFRFSQNCRVYIHEGSGVRMGTTDNLFTITADHHEMLTATMEDEVIATHTRNPTVVNIASSLVRHDYYMAEIFARFGDQIEAEFGKHLRDLRLACFTEEQAQSFRERTGLD